MSNVWKLLVVLYKYTKVIVCLKTAIFFIGFSISVWDGISTFPIFFNTLNIGQE